jgi:hypothetical protein
MSQPENRKRFAFDRSGEYRIRVQGFLDERWSDRLGGMRITKESKHVTSLIGVLIDQAALAGVLADLYELHLTLLSVEYLDD